MWKSLWNKWTRSKRCALSFKALRAFFNGASVGTFSLILIMYHYNFLLIRCASRASSVRYRGLNSGAFGAVKARKAVNLTRLQKKI